MASIRLRTDTGESGRLWPVFFYCIVGLDHGVGHPICLSVRGKSTEASEKRGVRGLRHHAECPQVADAVIEAVLWNWRTIHKKGCLVNFRHAGPRRVLYLSGGVYVRMYGVGVSSDFGCGCISRLYLSL